MKFLEALISESKNAALPEAYNYFGKLVGDWKIVYTDNNKDNSIEGEWHFAWILDGMAIQDVIILPGYEVGTTLRVYNPVTHAWDVSYCYTGHIMRLEARKEGDRIVLALLDNARRKWVFAKIEDHAFHWQDVTVKDDGTWRVEYDLYAERVRRYQEGNDFTD